MENPEMEAPPEKTPGLAYRRDEHHVHLIVSYLIWCSAYSRPALIGAIKERCCTMIGQKCQEKGWTILELAIRLDQLHLFGRVMRCSASTNPWHLFLLLEEARASTNEPDKKNSQIER